MLSDKSEVGNTVRFLTRFRLNFLLKRLLNTKERKKYANLERHY